MKRFWLLLIVVGSLGCAADTEPLAVLGDLCAFPEDCESGECFMGQCSAACTNASECESDAHGLICSPAGMCERRCASFGASSRSFAGGLHYCVDGDWASCAAADPVEACASCGCDVFGGGTCVEGIGCVVPRGAGEACTEQYECAAGLVCHGDDGQCGARRAMGEPCSIDAQCSTSNCSTDGAEGAVGVCNQALGTACVRGSGTCTDCYIRRGGLLGGNEGVCLRRACDPDRAPTCPHFGNHEFECARTNAGGHGCFERCPHPDVSVGHQCLRQGLYCRDGLIRDFCRRL